MLFLPLVENAFKYVGGKYEISITASHTNDGLTFKVVNAVPGQVVTPGLNSGIGLENLGRRLQLLYPDNHKLTVGKQADCFVAELRLNY